MKKTTVILMTATILFSCQKETITNSPKPETLAINHLQDIVFTSVIPTNEKSFTMVGTTKVVSYINTPIIAEIKPDLYDKTKSLIQLKANGKTSSMVAYQTVTNGISSIKYQSTTGLLYFSMKVNNTSNEITDAVFTNPIPFETLSTPAYPIGTSATYVSCMARAYNLCRQSMLCGFMFGTTAAGAMSAGIGWSIGCLSGAIH